MSRESGNHELVELLTVTALMTDPVIACDECGQMVYANLAAVQIFGDIDTENNCVDDCPEALGLLNCEDASMLELSELPLAQAAYQGKTVQRKLLVQQEAAASPVEATAFPVLDRWGRQIGAMMICRWLGAIPEAAQTQHWA